MSKKTDPLLPSKEKVKRAKEKFSNLKAGVNSYIASDPYTMRWETHKQAAYIIATLVKDLPANIAWELVEAIQHLRGALDKLVVALVEKNGRGTSGIGYPFGGVGNDGKPNPFPDGNIESRVKQKLSPAQWDLIAAQKPYPGGNDTLWAINVIANIDKHDNLLVEVLPFIDHTTAMQQISGGYSVQRNPVEHDLVLADKEREKVLLILTPTTGEEPKCNVQSKIAESVVFGPIVPVQGKNVLTTLNEQIRLVEGIVNIFDRTFFKP